MSSEKDSAAKGAEHAADTSLRILHYVPAVQLELGGVVRAVLDYCQVLAARGHRLTLATYDATDVPRQWQAPTGGVASHPSIRVLQRPRLPGHLLGRESLHVLRESLADADVVHLHGPWTPSNVQIARLARKANVPYVLTPHGMLDDWSMAQKWPKKRVVHWLMTRRLLNNAAAVHCTATGEAAQARKWFDHDRVAVLPCIVDLAPFESLQGPGLAREKFECLRRPGPKVLFVGRLHPKKGVELLIDAAGMAEGPSAAAQFMIAGSGEKAYEEDLRSRARRSPAGERIHFLGMVRGDEKLSLYEAADLFVLPTSQENFGLVLVEAMACGTPVMTTRGVDIWEELERAGMEIVEQSASAVARSMETLLADGSGLRTRGMNARQAVFEWLDPMQLCIGYERMYCGAIKSVVISAEQRRAQR